MLIIVIAALRLTRQTTNTWIVKRVVNKKRTRSFAFFLSEISVGKREKFDSISQEKIGQVWYLEQLVNPTLDLTWRRALERVSISIRTFKNSLLRTNECLIRRISAIVQLNVVDLEFPSTQNRGRIIKKRKKWPFVKILVLQNLQEFLKILITNFRGNWVWLVPENQEKNKKPNFVNFSIVPSYQWSHRKL